VESSVDAEDTLIWPGKENLTMSSELMCKYATQQLEFTIATGELHVLFFCEA
jgi:hypothetical protein